MKRSRGRRVTIRRNTHEHHYEGFTATERCCICIVQMSETCFSSSITLPKILLFLTSRILIPLLVLIFCGRVPVIYLDRVSRARLYVKPILGAHGLRASELRPKPRSSSMRDSNHRQERLYAHRKHLQYFRFDNLRNQPDRVGFM